MASRSSAAHCEKDEAAAWEPAEAQPVKRNRQLQEPTQRWSPWIKAGKCAHLVYARYRGPSHTSDAPSPCLAIFVRRWRLLHRDREVCVPGDVNPVANFDLIQHRRIGDTSAVFESVRTNEGDR